VLGERPADRVGELSGQQPVGGAFELRRVERLLGEALGSGARPRAREGARNGEVGVL
jgi:hypothetical protein